jgi:alkylation response protein AidB-like acyl-CoA dehydrogenase
MDFNLTPKQLEIKKLAREFAEREFPKVAKKCDREEIFDFELIKKACEVGLNGIFIDKDYGGAGYGYLENAFVMEEFWRVDPGLGGALTCVTFGSEMILLFGSDNQKRKYLPPLCKGEAISAVGVTEPDSGSDVLSISTRAEKEGDEYIINGSKMFISNGTIANFFITLCLTNPDSSSKYERHSVIIIEADRPGLDRDKLKGKMGIRAHDTARISFNGVRVPKENLIGEEGNGFNCFMAFFNRSRAYVAGQGLGVAQGALELAVKFVKKRKALRKNLAQLHIAQYKLAEMATWVETARNLVYKAAWNVDRGKIEPALISMSKWYAGEVGVKVVNEALQLHEGYGGLDEYDISRFYRDAKIVEIYEGTKEIEKLVIARQLLKGIGL